MNLIYRCINKVNHLVKRKIFLLLGYGDIVSKAVWEEQFSTDFWNYLGSEEEAAHYHTIVKFYNQYFDNGTLLDIGCGKGVLYNYLKQGSELSNLNYMGIDISENAIKAARLQFPNVSFEVLDFNHSTIDKKFDVIVFNETLYYFMRPLRTLKKSTLNNLTPNGKLIISMYSEPKNNTIWNQVLKHYKVLAEEVVENRKGQRWNIKLLCPIKE